MIVGFVGLAGSGKDTAAQVLLANRFKPAAFAAPLKRMCAKYGWDGHKDDRGRRLLQEIGCAWRHWDPDYWVNVADLQYRPENGPWCFTDVRFQNEAEFIRKRGGMLIGIVRPSMLILDCHQHESEASIGSIITDVTLENDGDIDALHKKVMECVLMHQASTSTSAA